MLALRNVFVCCVFLSAMCGVGRACADAADGPASARSSVRRTAFRKSLEVDQGWRRTDDGWVRTADWTVSSSGTDQTHATQLHPCLIAAFVLLVSTGALLTFEPLILRRKQNVTSDQALIQKWARSMRRRTEVHREDCL